MNNLFKQSTTKAHRVCKVENLNPQKGITVSYRVSQDQRRHTVVLCLADKTVKTVFSSELAASIQMNKYKQLYREIKPKR